MVQQRMPRVLLSEHSNLATPAFLAEQRFAGEQPHAVLNVAIPHGALERVVGVELDEEDLIVLAEKAMAALRMLRKERETR